MTRQRIAHGQLPITLRRALLGVAMLAVAHGALAASQRTFVASYGNDANSCALVLPCRSFNVAIGQVLDGGEVVVLDSAAYATFSVNKSVSVVAPPGVYAGISALSGTAVTVSGFNINVLLRGLTITGIGGAMGVSGAPGGSGELRIEETTISGFQYAVFAGAGNVVIERSRIAGNTLAGITASVGANLHVRNTVVENNAANSYGIDYDGFGAGAGQHSFVVEGSTIRHNGGTGIRIFARQMNPGGRLVATISTTVVSDNAGDGIDVSCPDGSIAIATVADSAIANSGGAGIVAGATGCSVFASHDVITGNGGTSMVSSGATFFGTYGDNRIDGNGTDTPSGTVTAVPSR